MTEQAMTPLMEDKSPFILHSQHSGWWWPGDARIQGITGHDLDLVIPDKDTDNLYFHDLWHLQSKCTKCLFSLHIAASESDNYIHHSLWPGDAICHYKS